MYTQFQAEVLHIVWILPHPPPFSNPSYLFCNFFYLEFLYPLLFPWYSYSSQQISYKPFSFYLDHPLFENNYSPPPCTLYMLCCCRDIQVDITRFCMFLLILPSLHHYDPPSLPFLYCSCYYLKLDLLMTRTLIYIAVQPFQCYISFDWLISLLYFSVGHICSVFYITPSLRIWRLGGYPSLSPWAPPYQSYIVTLSPNIVFSF
jgi:hypothetical protein